MRSVKTDLFNFLFVIRNDRNELRYAAQTTLWLRWLLLIGCLVESNYRVEYGSTSQILNTLYLLGLMAATGYVHRLVFRRQDVNPRWLLALSALDVLSVSFSVSLSGGFESRYFVIYYFVIVLFSCAFPSVRLTMLWTSLVAAIYTVLCLTIGPGFDLETQEEKILFYRLLALYGVAVLSNMISSAQRKLLREAIMREREADLREQELNLQRIELSHAIHDTTAQSAYMIGMGVESALEVADESNRELTRRLEALSDLSRSVMWELRHPIDGGRLFRDTSLSEVLREHIETFTLITSVHAEFVVRGEEPQMSIIRRSLLFSIAHNAMTNAFRHADPLCVTVGLDFGAEEIRMAISDDGLGLPDDYKQRGHGFRNMTASAARIGGRIEVHSGETGTTVSCAVPYSSDEGGE